MEGDCIGCMGFASIQDVAQNRAAGSSKLGAYLMEPPRAGMYFPQAAVGEVLKHLIGQDRFPG